MSKPIDENQEDYMTLSAIGERLRNVRQRLGFSQLEMNDQTNVSNTYISDFEHGKKTPSAKYLSALIRQLGVSLDFVFTGEGKMLLSEDKRFDIVANFPNLHEQITEMLQNMKSYPFMSFAVMEFYELYKLKVRKEMVISKNKDENNE